MTKLQPAETTAALRHRYATKKFDPARPLDDAAWDALREALVLAPSSFGLQPWRFVIVENRETRSRLREVSWNQPQITDAAKLVVVCNRDDLADADIDAWLSCLADSQGKSPADLAAYRGMIAGFCSTMSTEQRAEWNARQCYIALGQLMATAAMLGVDTCPLEGIDRAAYDEILGLGGSGYSTAVGCAIGYRAADDAYAALPKARFSRDAVVVVHD
jgi:nitroreductase